MRLPLIRFGADKTPLAPWEWLFAPVMLPLIFAGLLFMVVAYVPVEFLYRLQQRRQENRLRARLAESGRYLGWSEVEAKLRAGKGTLVVEHLSPKGPVREWWVEDDLISSAPVPLPTSLKLPPTEGQLKPLQEHAAACAAQYTNLASGSAKLTEVPVSLAQRFDPAKYVVADLGSGLMTAILLPTGRKLLEKYSAGKVVTLVTWLCGPLLFAGDAETVFLADAVNEPPGVNPG